MDRVQDANSEQRTSRACSKVDMDSIGPAQDSGRPCRCSRVGGGDSRGQPGWRSGQLTEMTSYGGERRLGDLRTCMREPHGKVAESGGSPPMHLDRKTEQKCMK